LPHYFAAPLLPFSPLPESRRWFIFIADASFSSLFDAAGFAMIIFAVFAAVFSLPIIFAAMLIATPLRQPFSAAAAATPFRCRRCRCCRISHYYAANMPRRAIR